MTSPISLSLNPVDLGGALKYNMFEVSDYQRSYVEYTLRVVDFVKENLGVSGSDGCSGMGFSDKMLEMAKQAAAKAGIVQPEKNAGVASRTGRKYARRWII